MPFPPFQPPAIVRNTTTVSAEAPKKPMVVTPSKHDGDLIGNESVDAQMAEIRKALRMSQEQEDAATCQRWRESRQSESRSPRNCARGGSELYYEHATELFKCIEECDWQRATRVLNSSPQQAEVWIVSTGTIETTFEWSRWKRLPIHEAARRQPPARFVTKLIKAYPESVRLKTQFDKLPLHLAVECGAEPAVVNLLAMHHWEGVTEKDQSGRRPIDILQEAVLLDPEEQQAVVDALQASLDTNQALAAQHETHLERTRMVHKNGLRAVQQQHDEDLRAEGDAQEQLLLQIAELQLNLSNRKAEIKSLESKISSYQTLEYQWRDKKQSLLDEIEYRNLETEQHCRSIDSLVETVGKRDAQLKVAKSQLQQLNSVVLQLSDWQLSTLPRFVEQAQTKLQNSITQFADLNTHVSGQQRQLRDVLQQLDLDPGDMVDDDENETTDPPPVGDDDVEEDLVDEEAMNRAARAASHVL